MKTPTTPSKEKPETQAKATDSAVTEAKQKKATSNPKPTNKPKVVSAKPLPAANTDQSVAAVTTSAKATKPSPRRKSPQKTKTVASSKVTGQTGLSMADRVGLTAGSVWHYLSENGATAVVKLVRELPEEEKIIQRSIGWLAQEGKISLVSSDNVETIRLKS